MEIAGFESAQYFAFVVSDLSQDRVLQLARGLAPALNETLRTTAFQGRNSHVLHALFKLHHVIPTSLTSYSMTTDDGLPQKAFFHMRASRALVHPLRHTDIIMMPVRSVCTRPSV
jgi:hypothetical protein